MDRTRVVAVIGAGFSGVMTAVHLLRSPAPHSLRVVLVNRTGKMARGVAYGTRSPDHLLNVAAGRMSALADEPEHFLRWAKAKDSTVTPGAFLPRSLYGEYLEDLLRDAERTTSGRLDRIVGELTAIDGGTAPARLTTTNGGAFSADRVVLALGNYPPGNPDIAHPAAFTAAQYVRDPWTPNGLNAVNIQAPILLVGTGLTMVDVMLDLHARGATGPVIAISRHGLLPQPHQQSIAADALHRPPKMESGPATALAYVRAVRQRVRNLERQGIGWRTVVDSLRPVTADLWQRLPLAERERFLRHVKPYWEVVRHRAAAGPAAALQERMAAGWLQVKAARLIDLQKRESGFVAVLRRRGASATEDFKIGTCINCTGPSGDVRTLADPLMVFLRERGMISPDPLGLGIAVAPDGAVIDKAGDASHLLYYIGPLARAGYWERTAVPELRVLARDIAKSVVESLWPEEPTDDPGL